mmetsp:Transcript_110182/g.322436  ORF Transcript_110182/g.322436 Transcript_110182/m.322436 type:complete len:270 (+) Transcript_110182:314-1123(+)
MCQHPLGRLELNPVRLAKLRHLQLRPTRAAAPQRRQALNEGALAETGCGVLGLPDKVWVGSVNLDRLLKHATVRPGAHRLSTSKHVDEHLQVHCPVFGVEEQQRGLDRRALAIDVHRRQLAWVRPGHSPEPARPGDQLGGGHRHAAADIEPVALSHSRALLRSHQQHAPAAVAVRQLPHGRVREQHVALAYGGVAQQRGQLLSFGGLRDTTPIGHEDDRHSGFVEPLDGICGSRYEPWPLPDDAVDVQRYAPGWCSWRWLRAEATPQPR